MLDFLFERNEQDEISNIYNYPRGMGTTQTIILLAVNCNSSQKIHNFFSKMYWQVLKKDIIYRKISKQTKRVLKEVRKC